MWNINFFVLRYICQHQSYINPKVGRAQRFWKAKQTAYHWLVQYSTTTTQCTLYNVLIPILVLWWTCGYCVETNKRVESVDSVQNLKYLATWRYLERKEAVRVLNYTREDIERGVGKQC
jgi:hypothetical protein